MALETGTFISDLVATNPTGSDALAFSDDHLRLIKSTVKNTFPNISGAVTVSHTDLNSKVPNAIQKDGSVAMTGSLTLSGNASSSLHAVPLQQMTAAVQALYPVGSVYINATNATNPATLLGFGTWVAFGAGRVPVGFDAADTNFNAAEKTGGSKDATVVAHTHTGTTTTNGDHFHQPAAGGAFVTSAASEVAAGGSNWSFNRTSSNTTTNGAHNHTFTTDSTGTSGTNANLQPYITVYMWKRTA